MDAIRAAVRARQIGQGEGRFAVTWDPAARSLTWEDNGIGMDAGTIQAKFLSLGDSGKREASGSSDEAAGGFGVAKAVILGVASEFRWELHTRDNLARPSAGGAVPIDDAPLRQGTRITVYDVGSDFDSWFDHARSEWVDLKDRLRLVLGACDLPGIALSLNGEPVEPFFNRRGGSRIQAGSFGEGTTATVKGYRRSDRGGAYWIRLGGLYQFHAGTRRGRLPADAAPVPRALARLQAADAEVERREASLRVLRALDLSARVGYDSLAGQDDESPYFAVVSASINLGVVWQLVGNRDAAAGRRRMLERAPGGAGNRARLEAELASERDRAAATAALADELERQHRELKSLGGDASRRIAQTIWFDLVRMRAERAYLDAHVAALAVTSGWPHMPTFPPNVTVPLSELTFMFG